MARKKLSPKYFVGCLVIVLLACGSEQPNVKDSSLRLDLIEQAIKGLPLQLRQVLKMRYVSHPYASLNQLAHNARTTPHKLETDLHNAKKRLQHELDKKSKSNHHQNLYKVQAQKNN